MAKASKRAERIAVVTIHGTGDTADSPKGEKWYQLGSHFTQALLARLTARGLSAEIVPFIWSGGNSAHERETGAERLASRIRRLANTYAGVHVLGYSHGGNVANDAAGLLRWGRAKANAKEPIDSLITIGTPFLNSRQSALQSLGGLLFLGVTLLSLPLFFISILLLLLWALGETTYRGAALLRPDIADPLGISNGPVGTLIDAATTAANLPLSSGTWIFMGLWTLIIGIPLWFMFRLALRGWRQLTRPRRAAGDHARVFAVWHANDEAISFLQRVDALPLQAFPSGSVLRSSRSAALNAGVATVLIAPVIAAFLTAFPGGKVGSDWVLPLQALGSSIVMALFVGPPLFAIVYVLIRVFAASAGEFVARPRLNNWIADILRGIAFGRDNDLRIGQVATRSHIHATREYVLEGELSQRMLSNAEVAASKLIERYRWAVFTVGADSNAPLTELANDAMTWASLIHTTYLDQPEILDLIADHIAAEVKAKQAKAFLPELAGPASTPLPTSSPELAEPVSKPSPKAARPARPRRSEVPAFAAIAAGIVVAIGAGSALAWFGLAQFAQTGSADWASIEPPVTSEAPSAVGASGAIVAEQPASIPMPDDGVSLKTPAVLVDQCPDCPTMIRVGPGSFAMGAGEDDPQRQPWEGPQHSVTVRPFLISAREVTFAQWDTCVADGGCNREAEPRDGGWGRGDRPVIRVSWRDAKAYVAWLSRRTGQRYRLPSEAEWEFAARGGTSTRYWWGRNFEANRSPKASTAPVGSFTANAFGLFDVTGNVNEWVEDCYVNTFASAPTDGSPVQAQSACQRRVVRGGSWRDRPSSLRITARSRIGETVRDSTIGFRVARDDAPASL